jgi:hypothetical protein
MKSSLPIRVAVCSFLLSSAAGAQTLHFSQKWWDSINDREQEGFFWGYMDSPCAPAIQGTYQDVAKFLDGYFPAHPNVTVPAALQIAKDHIKPQKPLPGGEIWTDAHGFMDGGWWGDSTHGEPLEQRGYVEGYLACRHQPVRAEDVEFYKTAIDRYYDSPKHEHTKIAYVIEPMLERKRAD